MEKNPLYDRVYQEGIIAVISGLKSFGSLWSFPQICSAIDKHSHVLLTFLTEAANYGAIDILTALCVIVDCACGELTKAWFRECLEHCARAKYVIDLAEKYERSRYELMKLVLSSTRNDNYLLRISAHNFEQYIWENMPPELLNNTPRYDYANVGIWFPGIHQKKLDEAYLKTLDEKVFPLLRRLEDELPFSSEDTRNRLAIVRERIHHYLSELNHHYSRLNNTLIQILKDNPSDLSSQNCYVFTQLINRYVYAEEQEYIYLTPNFVESIEKLYASILNNNDTDKSLALNIKHLFPLFWAMVGNNSKAYENLVVQMSTIGSWGKVNNAYLLAFYRCLLVTQNEANRNRLIAIFDEIYINKSGSILFLSLGESIVRFFANLSERLKGEEYLGEELICDHYVINHWLKTGLIEKTLSQSLEIYRACFLGQTTSPEKLDRAFIDFQQLFYALTSHLDTLARIEYDRVKSILDPYAPDYSTSEVYGIYTKDEIWKLQGFRERFIGLQGFLPNGGSLWKYVTIKEKAAKYWKKDRESVLCEKLLTALRGLQSNYFTSGKREDALNNDLAFYLKAYYGEESVHREEPQGLSGTLRYQGETDILVYDEGYQFALIEGVRFDLNSNDSFIKNELNKHMTKLLQNYNTQGAAQTVLVIYAEGFHGMQLFDKIEQYLKNYPYPFELQGPLSRLDGPTANICHHCAAYNLEGYSRSLHVFTVLLQAH